MDVLQIITTIGVAFVASAAIASYLYNRKQNKPPYSEAITKDVLDQISEQIEIPSSEVPAKPKKKRPGVHSKKKQSKNKNSKNYVKPYNNQGK